MTVFKCKMCGGTLEFNEGDTVAVCDSCGTKQTLPRLDDDRRTNLFGRADHFRRNTEFDKAISIYEQILNEDDSDAEAYWGLVLCRYGIEYVEDPLTAKRIPTVNRTQFTSIFDDEDYKEALAHADEAQKQIYQQEAETINEIQKGILAISQKEKPFDVFICYKETDTEGKRTPDSVLANDLYHQLTQEGFKVFFSRITLEDKLGTAYEPYIFAALNSAKVMVVLGTKPEYFNAVWVKNEWSRYLSLVKTSGGKKVLIPAYKDMDPYDLPDEFSHLQALDMGKLGFMQDLIRGIKKITVSTDSSASAVKETVAVNGNANANTAPLLKRAFMFLEDGNWAEADSYCERVLDQDPENAEAYIGKLMAELHVKTREALVDQAEPFDSNNNYQKAVRFGAESIRSELEGYTQDIKDREERLRLEALYQKASVSVLNCNYDDAISIYESLKDFKDSASLKKDAVYKKAAQYESRNTVEDLEKAIQIFETINGWKDADERIQKCRADIAELNLKAEEERIELELLVEQARIENAHRMEQERIERERKAEQTRIASVKRKKITAIVLSAVAVCTAVVLLLTFVIIPAFKYNSGVKKYESGNYQEAYEAFKGQNYKDSGDKEKECLYIIQKARIKDVKIGDTILLGSYDEQEEMEWIVLDVANDKALLISKYVICIQQYNNERKAVPWEACSLRKWLNEDFYEEALGNYYTELICKAEVSADANPEYTTYQGNATQDNVFLLSIPEAEKYFKSNTDRMATNVYGQSCWWWLRSLGYTADYAASIYGDGSIYFYGSFIYDRYGVRPAIWIDLDAVKGL